MYGILIYPQQKFRSRKNVRLKTQRKHDISTLQKIVLAFNTPETFLNMREALVNFVFQNYFGDVVTVATLVAPDYLFHLKLSWSLKTQRKHDISTLQKKSGYLPHLPPPPPPGIGFFPCGLIINENISKYVPAVQTMILTKQNGGGGS